MWAAPNDLQATFRNALGAEAYNALSAGQTLYLNDERGELTLTPDFITDFAKYDLQGILRNWHKRPLLILHGEKDETVAADQARLTFALAGVPKSWLSLTAVTTVLLITEIRLRQRLLAGCKTGCDD